MTLYTPNAKYKTLFPAVMTTLTPDGTRLNESTQRDVIRQLLSWGAKGFYPCGTTGEGPRLDLDERMRVAEIAKEEIGDKATLIVHVGYAELGLSKRLAKHAAEINADAISAVTPQNIDASALPAYYDSIIQAGQLPMFVYFFPELTGEKLTLEMVDDLFAVDGVVGAKCTFRDSYLLERIIRHHPEKIILSGHDECLVFGLMTGATGAVGATYNFTLPEFLRIQSLVAEHRYSEALSYQKDLNDLIQQFLEICGTVVVPGVKYSFEQRTGIEVGPCRDVEPLTDEQKARIRAELVKNHMLKE